MTDTKKREALKLYDRWIRDVEGNPVWWKLPAKDRKKYREDFLEKRLVPLVGEDSEEVKAYKKLLTPSATRKFFSSLGTAAQEATGIPSLLRVAAKGASVTTPSLGAGLAKVAEEMPFARSPAQMESPIGQVAGGIAGGLVPFVAAERALASIPQFTEAGLGLAARLAPKAAAPAVAEGVAAASPVMTARMAAPEMAAQAERLAALGGAGALASLPHVLAEEAPVEGMPWGAVGALAGFGPAKIRTGMIGSAVTSVAEQMALHDHVSGVEVAKSVGLTGLLRGTGLVKGLTRRYQNAFALKQWLAKNAVESYPVSPIPKLDLAEVEGAVARKEAQGLLTDAQRMLRRLEEILLPTREAEAALSKAKDAYESFRGTLSEGKEERILQNWKTLVDYISEAEALRAPEVKEKGYLALTRKAASWLKGESTTEIVTGPKAALLREFGRTPIPIDPLDFYTLSAEYTQDVPSQRAQYVADALIRQWGMERFGVTKQELATALDDYWRGGLLTKDLTDAKGQPLLAARGDAFLKSPTPDSFFVELKDRVKDQTPEGVPFYRNVSFLSPEEVQARLQENPDAVIGRYDFLVGRLRPISGGGGWELGVKPPPKSVPASFLRKSLQNLKGRLERDEGMPLLKKQELWTLAVENARHLANTAFKIPTFTPKVETSLEGAAITPRRTWYVDTFLVQVDPQTGTLTHLFCKLDPANLDKVKLSPNNAIIFYRPLTGAFEVVKAGDGITHVSPAQDILDLSTNLLSPGSMYWDWVAVRGFGQEKFVGWTAERMRRFFTARKIPINALNTGEGLSRKVYIKDAKEYQPVPPKGAKYTEVPVTEVEPYIQEELKDKIKISKVEKHAVTLGGKTQTYYVINAEMPVVHLGPEEGFNPYYWLGPRIVHPLFPGPPPAEPTREKPYGGYWASVQGARYSWASFAGENEFAPVFEKATNIMVRGRVLLLPSLGDIKVIQTGDLAGESVIEPTHPVLDVAKKVGADVLYVPGHYAVGLRGWDADTVLFLSPAAVYSKSPQSFFSRELPPYPDLYKVNTVTGTFYKGEPEPKLWAKAQELRASGNATPEEITRLEKEAAEKGTWKPVSPEELPPYFKEAEHLKDVLPWDKITKDILLSDLAESGMASDPYVFEWARSIMEGPDKPFVKADRPSFYAEGEKAVRRDLYASIDGYYQVFGRELVDKVVRMFKDVLAGKEIPEHEVKALHKLFQEEKDPGFATLDHMFAAPNFLQLVEDLSELTTKRDAGNATWFCFYPNFLYALRGEQRTTAEKALTGLFEDARLNSYPVWAGNWRKGLAFYRGLHGEFYLVCMDPPAVGTARNLLTRLENTNRTFVHYDAAEPSQARIANTFTVSNRPPVEGFRELYQKFTNSAVAPEFRVPFRTGGIREVQWYEAVSGRRNAVLPWWERARGEDIDTLERIFSGKAWESIKKCAIVTDPSVWRTPIKGVTYFLYNGEQKTILPLPPGTSPDHLSMSSTDVLVRTNWGTGKVEYVAGNQNLLPEVRITERRGFGEGIYLLKEMEGSYSIFTGDLSAWPLPISEEGVVYSWNPFLVNILDIEPTPIAYGRRARMADIALTGGAASLRKHVPRALPLADTTLDTMYKTFLNTLDTLEATRQINASEKRGYLRKGAELYKQLSQNVFVYRMHEGEQVDVSPEEVKKSLLMGERTVPIRPSTEERIDYADPIQIMALLQSRGVTGVWNAATGDVEVRVSDGGWARVPLQEIEKMPRVGDLLQGRELVLNLGERDFLITEGVDGKYKVVPKGLPSATRAFERRDALTADELADILSVTDYRLVYVAPAGVDKGKCLVLDLKTGEYKYISQEQAIEKGTSPLPELAPVKGVEPNADSLQPSVSAPDATNAAADWTPPPRPASKPKRPVAPPTAPPAAEPPKALAKPTFWQKTSFLPQRLADFVMYYAAPMRSYLSRMQTRTGLPLAEAWRDVDNGQRWVMDWSKKIYKDVALLFNDVKPNRQGVLGGYLAIRDPARRLDFAKANNMSRKELRAAAVARKLLREAVGEYYQDMISDDIPSYLTKRAVGGRDIEVPVDLKPWLDYGLQPELWDHGANLVDSVIRTKMRRVLGERVESAEAMLKSALKEGKVKGETAREIKRAFMKYILGVENSISGDLVNTTRVIQYLNETFGLQLKGDLAGNLANSAIQIIYASTMAFRPGIALRNLMQTFVTLTPYVGPKAVLEGYRKAFTPEGQRWAKRFQVWTQAHIPVEEFVHGSSLVPGAIRKGMLVGMTPFKSADAMTRAAAVNAARYLWGLHYPKFASGEMSLREFMRNTGLVYLEKAAQVEVLRALDTGKTDHALHMYADNLSDSTLWIYRSGNSPMLFKSAAGRLMGQFGTWPISYIRWATRGLMSGKEDPMASLRFAAFWYAVNQSLLELGRSVLGTDFSSWLFAGPFLFTGGPALQFLATARNLTAAPEYMRERAWQGVKRTATALIPFYGAGRDLNDTLNAEDWREALREFFGQREAK